ncbi:hypothetical protein KO498_17595 [Lentibacter algarum]|uniref:hypothetical protein n=1 Tax=Lentibacter algarum TaxID=576131 RepID=UPI001C0818EC|nr:hypothetical protein [Lentibacter algarum]MBU2983626.1 hypothetical protein [Lentibacter algarum]
MNPVMQAIIEDAYQVFNRAKPADTEVCKACCLDPKIEADFFKPDIRELPLSYLQGWFEAAATPAQVSLTLSRYLLPRVFDLLAQREELTLVGTEVALQRFATGDTSRWTETENELIASFTRLHLDDAEQYDTLDEILCMFSAAGHKAQDLIDQIWAWPDEEVFCRLADCWGPSPAVIIPTAFWNGGSGEMPIHAENAKTIADWYRSDALNARAKTAYETAPAGSQLRDDAQTVLTAIASA